MKANMIPNKTTGANVTIDSHSDHTKIAQVRHSTFAGKPDQVFICEKDVEVIIRTFNDRPQPNSKMVQAHKMARLLFS